MRRIQAKARATGRGLIENLEQRTLLSTIYVNAAAGGAVPDGSTWQQAFTDLHSALAAAGTGDEIWVAAGTYKPTDGMPNPNDRNVSFHLKNQVGVYGGFNGTESTRAQRDWSANVTTLSGDIGAIGDVADNSASVITNSNIDSSAVLDGFTVTAGNGWASGMWNVDSSPTVSNVVFRDNLAAHSAAGVESDNGAPVFTNCAFVNNVAGQDGGAVKIINSSSVFIDCSFVGNSGGRGGGAVLNAGSSATKFINTTFRQNSIKVSPYTSVPFGGAIENIGASLTLTNCTFIGNSSEALGGAVDNSGGTVTLTNCTFLGNSAVKPGGAISNFGSAVVTNCLFVGNSSLTRGGGAIVSGGTSLTVTNSTFAGNSAFNDGGAVSVSGGTAVLTNSIVWGNTNASWSGQLAAAIAGTFTVSFSLVQGGWTGVGSNNITDDPQFVRPPSPGGDGAWGTGDDDYGDLRLQLTSPAIDAGDNGTVPAGVITDLPGKPRFADVPTRPDTGAGTPPIVDMGAYEQDPPPTLVSSVSRKTHGSAGDFDLTLSLTGTTRATGATIEPRKDGPTQVVFTFSEPVQAADGTLDASEFTVANATFANASLVGSTLTLSLTGAINTKYVTVQLHGLTDAASNPLTGDTDVTIGALYGDIDGSGSVNLLDFQRVKLNLLQPLTASTFLSDLDCSGGVNLLDFQVVKANLLAGLS